MRGDGCEASWLRPACVDESYCVCIGLISLAAGVTRAVATDVSAGASHLKSEQRSGNACVYAVSYGSRNLCAWAVEVCDCVCSTSSVSSVVCLAVAVSVSRDLRRVIESMCMSCMKDETTL